MAACLGTRLKDRTRTLPKALISLEGRPLLAYVLDAFLSRSWVDRAVVVTGFEREQVRDYLRSRRDSKPIQEQWNPDFKKGNFYSLLCGLAATREGFVVTNADHLFPRALLDHVYENTKGVTATCDFDRKLAPDCMKVKLYSGSEPRRVEKIHKQLTEFDCGYIGMTWVKPEGRVAYLDAVGKVNTKGEESAWAEQVLENLASQGPENAPFVADASGFGWLEIDDEADYQRATVVLKEHPRFFDTGLD